MIVPRRGTLRSMVPNNGCAALGAVILALACSFDGDAGSSGGTGFGGAGPAGTEVAGARAATGGAAGGGAVAPAGGMGGGQGSPPGESGGTETGGTETGGTEAGGSAAGDGSGGLGGIPAAELVDRDFVGIPWVLESYNDGPVDADPPSLLVYRETTYLADGGCPSPGGTYTRDGPVFSGKSLGSYDVFGCTEAFTPHALVNGQYWMWVEAGTMTLEGAGRAVYHSDYAAEIAATGLAGRRWHLVQSTHPKFPETQHLDYVVEFEPTGIRDVRIDWACGECSSADCNRFAGSFGVDGQGGIMLYLSSFRYGLPCSLSGSGNPDLELVTGIHGASEFEVSGDGLTLRSGSSELFEFAAE
jgi:hypothetical protein